MSETNCNNRLVLCWYLSENNNYIRRWLKPYTIVEAKCSCGCYDHQYARDIGSRPCILCSEENVEGENKEERRSFSS